MSRVAAKESFAATRLIARPLPNHGLQPWLSSYGADAPITSLNKLDLHLAPVRGNVGADEALVAVRSNRGHTEDIVID